MDTVSKEKSALLWDEMLRYEERTAMTDIERTVLRKWVSEGHSVFEHPESRYLCLYGAWPPPDFLSVYRMDEEIRQALKGKTSAEKEEYLKEYVGYTEKSTEEKEERIARENTPLLIKKYVRKLEREVFYLGLFLSQEGLYEEAHEYVNDHMDEPIPFEFD